MASPPPTRVHPTALLSAETELADGVQVGPYVVTEGPVKIGPGCIIRPHTYLVGTLTLGPDNDVGTGCILGERPQHLRDAGEGTCVEIGAANVFREHVTVHRGTQATGRTVIGNHNFFMANSHVAHDCVIGNHCVFTNGSLLGGHCVVGDRAYLSGNSGVQQFTRIGRLAFLSGASVTTKDIPPFITQQGFNCVGGVNIVGMRRAGFTTEQITAVRTAFRVLYMQGLLIGPALAKLEQELGHLDVVAELIAFIRQSQHGITTALRRRAA
jgi:UDP-N-acetylglucosamine acyltransferase